LAKRKRFEVVTPLGHRVRLTRDRWREIVRYKHPAVAGHDTDVENCLRDPVVIRESINDPNTHLYYRIVERGFICVVVGGDDPRDRFVITAYFTQDLRERICGQSKGLPRSNRQYDHGLV
jgi:hypothetical protein